MSEDNTESSLPIEVLAGGLAPVVINNYNSISINN